MVFLFCILAIKLIYLTHLLLWCFHFRYKYLKSKGDFWDELGDNMWRTTPKLPQYYQRWIIQTPAPHFQWRRLWATRYIWGLSIPHILPLDGIENPPPTEHIMHLPATDEKDTRARDIWFSHQPCHPRLVCWHVSLFHCTV